MLMKRRHRLILLLSIVLVFTAVILMARAGGAGGDSFSGGGGGDDGLGTLIYIIFRLLIELPFPINVIAIGIVLGGFALFSYISKKKIKEQTIYNQLPTGEGVKKAKG